MSTRLALPLALTLLVGCAEAPPVPDAVSRAADPSGATTAATSADFVSQEIDDRYIYIRSSGESCDGLPHDGWIWDPLFPGSTGRLSEFCVLTPAGSGGGSLPVAPSSRLSKDRYALAGLGIDPATRAALRDNTIDLIDPVASYAGGSMPTKRSRLTLLDTVPTSDSPMTESTFDDHGTRLAAIADAAVCDKETGGSRNCAASVTSQLAMAWVRTSGGYSSATSGGSIGRQSDLAVAIVDAIDDWESDKATTSSLGRLVLNLSLSWHPESAGGHTAAEEAVYAALQYASCQDVLVLAAAGHDDTPENSGGATGASYPAAWEADKQPSSSVCGDLGGDNRASSTTSYTPLLHAVSSVNHAHERSVFVRPGSAPRIVAPGEFLSVVPSATGGGPTRPISGTSASTVVVASAAAVVLTVDPSLSAHDAMQLVYDSGNAVLNRSGSTVAAKLYQGTADDIHTVSVCSAALDACDGTCGWVGGACSNAPVSPVLTVDTTATFEDVLGGATSVSKTTCPGPSGFKYFYGAATWPAVNCPTQQALGGGAVATVLPMPSNKLCPHCPVGIGGGATDPAFAHIIGTMPLDEVDNLTVTFHFEQGVGDPRQFPLASVADPVLLASGQHEIDVEFPPGAGWRTTGVAPDLVEHPAIGVTLDYTLHGYSHSEVMYLE